LRQSKQLPSKEKTELYYRSAEILTSEEQDMLKKFLPIVSVISTEEKIESALYLRVNTDEFFIPWEGNMNSEEEKEKLRKDLEYQQGFLTAVMKKLSNEKFMQNAKPDVIAAEEKKRDDAAARIKVISEILGL